MAFGPLGRISRRGWFWFAGFTAAFAALVAFVFWGTWSLDFVPVMPDAPTSFAPDDAARTLRSFLEGGRFIPFDIISFIGSPYLWVELKYALALYLAALGMAWFCRGRGLPPLACCGAGLLLAFSGYWLTLFSAGHYGWFQWMAHGIWGFGLADRAVREGRLRHWLLLGAVVSWAGYNQQDLWLLFSIFTAAYFLWCCWRERRLPWKGALVALAAFALIGLPNFCNSAAGVLKGREDQIARGENITQKGASDEEKRWEFVTNWSLPPNETLEFLVPRVNGDTSCPFVLSVNRGRGVRPYTGALGRPLNAKEGNYRQHSLLVGWFTCLFAIIGVLSLCRRRSGAARSDVSFFAIAALVFYALSLGRYFAPAYRVVFSLPFGDLIRCPVKWHHLTEFALAVLAAYGMQFALARMPTLFASRPRLARLVPYALGVALAVGLIGLAANAHLYCAPVSVAKSRRAGLGQSLTILTRQQFQEPQVAAMARAGRIVSVANYLGHPDYFVVSLISPHGPRPKPNPIPPITVVFGLVSVAASLGVVGFSVWSFGRSGRVDANG